MAWTPEGRRLVTGASSGEFTLWNGLTFNFETILQAHDSPVRSMIWSHNDIWMVTADHAGYVKYWQSNMNNVKMFQVRLCFFQALSKNVTEVIEVTFVCYLNIPRHIKKRYVVFLLVHPTKSLLAVRMTEPFESGIFTRATKKKFLGVTARMLSV